jgi:hypothetical protein
MVTEEPASAKREVLLMRDPTGQWYAFPREEAERWRLGKEQQAELTRILGEEDVAGFARDVADGLPTGSRSHRPIVLTMELPAQTFSLIFEMVKFP